MIISSDLTLWFWFPIVLLNTTFITSLWVLPETPLQSPGPELHVTGKVSLYGSWWSVLSWNVADDWWSENWKLYMSGLEITYPLKKQNKRAATLWWPGVAAISCSVLKQLFLLCILNLLTFHFTKRSFVLHQGTGLKGDMSVFRKGVMSSLIILILSLREEVSSFPVHHFSSPLLQHVQ